MGRSFSCQAFVDVCEGQGHFMVGARRRWPLRPNSLFNFQIIQSIVQPG